MEGKHALILIWLVLFGALGDHMSFMGNMWQSFNIGGGFGKLTDPWVKSREVAEPMCPHSVVITVQAHIYSSWLLLTGHQISYP